MNSKRVLRGFFALILSVFLLLPGALVPASATGAAELRIALISDPHVYPDAMTGNFCEAFIEAQAPNGRAIESTQALFEAALADLKQRVTQEKIDFLLLPGDLTEWGEYAGHALVARLLVQFEQETGVQVAVAPGNHDLSNGDARDFSSGAKERARFLAHDEFPRVYAELGYDLPNCTRFGLSYAADLGSGYRLIAVDTNRRRLGTDERYSQGELRDWVLEQCEKARAAGKVIIGMGHHPLGEMFGGMDTFMGENYGFGPAGEAAEAFADAGMHFYVSGHLHFNEIAMRVSDRGEPLYDIMTASSAFFPGGYRTVKFSAAGKRVSAGVRSHGVPLGNPSPHPGSPFYKTLYGRSFGSPDGAGLAGWLKHAVRFALGPALGDIRTGIGYLDRRLFERPERLLEVIYGLVEEIVALPVSKLPCTRFIEEYGFGDPNRPGTFEDMGNSALIYLFGKRHDPAEDPFMLDALRRFQNGEFVGQLLAFAVPKVVAALGGEVLPLLMNSPAAIRALKTAARALDCPLLYLPLLAVAAGPGIRGALSDSLYRFAGGVIQGQSPTGGRDGTLVYDGPVEVPMGPETFRLPQGITVRYGWRSAEITWCTRPSARTPELAVTGKDGGPAPEVKISIASQSEEIMAAQLDIGYAKILGRAQPVLRHTARLEGLKPGKAYVFTAGDGAWGWRGPEFR